MPTEKPRFPCESLVPSGGEIYCHIFENALVGIPRSLFWSTTINFERVQYGKEGFECSLTCEWIPWPIRNWRKLDQRRLDVRYGQDGIESSFYMCEHDLATHTKLALDHRRDNIFRVSAEMSVNFSGFYGGDNDPAMPVKAEAEIPFIGLLVIPENLSPSPSSVAEIETVAATFVDLSAYEKPELWDKGGFIFRPRLT